MQTLAEVPYTHVVLKWRHRLNGSDLARAKQLRGAVAQAFLEDDRFHQHDTSGKQVYRYPLIQYRWQHGNGMITAWSEAAATLLNIPWLNLPLRLGEDEVIVNDALITVEHAHFGISERLLHYQLVTPALIFNQHNIAQYRQMKPAAQQAERERLLVAQLLRTLKGLQVDFPVILYAAFAQIQFSSCPYKGRNLIGISGEFVSNALLPSGIGIGHAVSHGYGWIQAEAPPA